MQNAIKNDDTRNVMNVCRVLQSRELVMSSPDYVE